MIEHGITTTKAHYWVHIFPLLRRVFWYRVVHCRDYIDIYKPVTHLGHSKDGTATGGGYLIPQNTYFVLNAEIPSHYLYHADWSSLTDRESGLRGEAIAMVLIEHRLVQFSPFFATAVQTRKAQFEATDCQIRWMPKRTIEFKTELVQTKNLFVQRWESGHRVHVTRAGTQRITQFPNLLDDGAAE